MPAAAIRCARRSNARIRTFARAPQAGERIFVKRAKTALRPMRCANTAASAFPAARRLHPAPAATTYVRATRNGSTTIAHRTEPASRNALTAYTRIRREALVRQRTSTDIIKPVLIAVL